MSNYKVLHVWMGTRKVGTLALAANHLAAFEYDPEWISDGFLSFISERTGPHHNHRK